MEYAAGLSLPSRRTGPGISGERRHRLPAMRALSRGLLADWTGGLDETGQRLQDDTTL